MEAVGDIANPWFKVEMSLKERKAFDEKTAADLNAVTLNLASILDTMEKSGLIARTSDGKVYMTSKGQERSIRGFKVDNNFPNKKFVRFSRNK